ncbi:MAG TPA: AarF/UbiB family protein, partial [Candidatus Acidoferrales bacterium]|nr:AarF/UbiB family protein [Candidatus Acidoferrales bacterium]
MAESKLHHGWRIAQRSAQMASAGLIAVAVFCGEWLRRRGDAPALHAVGRAWVTLSTRLGATFIKIGQIASTRGDLLPRPIIQELSTLQDQVPAFAYPEVRQIIESEFCTRLEDLFSKFDETPVAAASVAQVHRAVWRATGEVVAVKVRRPDILEKVQLDRSILLFVARLLENVVPSLRLISLEVSIRNFCEAVEQQIHLTNEAEHNRRFTANFADDPDVHFPRLVPEGCSDAVLTMEFIEGVREP